MPVVIFFVCLDLEPDSVDFEILVNQKTYLYAVFFQNHLLQ